MLNKMREKVLQGHHLHLGTILTLEDFLLPWEERDLVTVSVLNVLHVFRTHCLLPSDPVQSRDWFLWEGTIDSGGVCGPLSCCLSGAKGCKWHIHHSQNYSRCSWPQAQDRWGADVHNVSWKTPLTAEINRFSPIIRQHPLSLPNCVFNIVKYFKLCFPAHMFSAVRLWFHPIWQAKQG